MKRLVLLLLPALFLACDSSDSPGPAASLDTEWDLEGTWDAESEAGLLFDFRLNQQGGAITGDVGLNGQRAGLAGRIAGDSVTLEANFDPVIFFDAEIRDNNNLFGTIGGISGNSVGRFAAVKR